MKQYFYIPKVYEVALSTDINNYLNADSSNYSIVVGVYETTQETIDTSNSLVVSRLVNSELQYIKNGFENTNFNQETIKKKLIGFILEGDLQNNFPAFYNQILALPDCLIFDTNTDCLTFLNSIN
jgi:hypothetical protein